MLFVVAAIVAAVLFARGGASSSSAPGGPVVKGKPQVAEAGQSLGLPPAWVDWLIWVAKGESGWSTAAHNDSAGERAADQKGYARLVDEGRWPCPPRATNDGIGSGGWYGQLAYLTVHFGVPMGFGCDPLVIWRDPIASTRAHLAQVRGTLQILRNKTNGGGTFLQLRALYGLPSRDPATVDTPERRAGYSKTLQSAGINPAFLDRLVPDLPGGL